MKKVDHRLIALCGKARDGEISAEERDELEAFLLSGSEARQYYLRFMQIDALLEKFPPIDDEELDEAVNRNRVSAFRISTTGGWLALAAAITLLGTLAFLRMNPGAKSSDTSTSVAVLILAEDCQWKGRQFVEGQRLSPQALKLESGTAVVRFVGGAEAVLSGEAALELTHATAASLLYGEVVIRAEDGAEGFILNTPTGRLVDLGTEFAVKVRDDGDTELHVHEGEVAVGDETLDEDVIGAGHAVRMSRNKLERSEVTLDAPRFRELIDRANPRERRDLMMSYEGFHVEAGSYPPATLNSGKGWAGPWRLRLSEEFQRQENDSSTLMTIAHSQMEIAWPLKGGQLGMLEMPSGQNVRIRKMQKPIQMGKWGIRYFSFLVTEPERFATPAETGATNERSDMRLTFRSSDDYFGESLSFGWGSQLKPRVASNLGPSFRSLRKIPEGQTVFCVAKITTRKEAGDEIAFRFYTREDPLDIVEPAEWDIVTSGIAQNAAYDLLLLTSHSNQVRYIDEIRIGPSWRSVTPIEKPMLMSQVSDPKQRE